MRRALLVLSLLVCSLDAVAAVTGHVVDDDGKPLAGARVRAIALESQDAFHARLASGTPEPVALAETQTNDAGAFRVDTKRTAVVTLVIDAPGRVPAIEDVVDGDEATFQLRAAAMKTGRVTAGGKPVANALVILNSWILARSDEAGQYSVPDPAGWANRLNVLHPDYAMVERNRTRDTWPSLDVALESGAVARGRVVDAAGRPVANAILRNGDWAVGKSGEDGAFAIAHLPAAARTLHAREGNRVGSAKVGAETIVLRPAATIAGSVRSSKDDTPVAGAKVTALGDAATTLATAVADGKGNFILDAVPAGVVQLSISHPAYSAAIASDVQAIEGQRTDRALIATPLARLAGTVVDEQKKPVSAARVTIMGRPAFTAPDGTFSIRFASMERSITADVSKPEYAAATYGPLRAEPGEVKSGVRITLARGTKFEVRLVDADGVAIGGEPVVLARRIDPDERFRITPVRCGNAADASGCRTDDAGKLTVNLVEDVYDIRAGGTATVVKELVAQKLTAADSPLVIELERGAVVEGRVVWSDGSPVTVPASINSGTRGAFVPVVDGAFTMKNVPAGKLTLTAQTAPPNIIAGTPVEVTAPATGVVLKIPRPGRIEGRVVDRESQRAVTRFTVAAEARAGMRPGNTRSFTPEDGRFVYEDVAPGAVDLVVTSPGYVRSTTSSVEVTEGKPVTVDVALERAGTVIGRVSSGGRPVAGASVSVPEQRGRTTAAKQTDANGEYTLDTLPAGSHQVNVRKQGFVAKSITVNVAVGKEVRGDVELSSGREVHGRVVDTGGRPVAGAEVMPDSRGGGRPSFELRVTTDADGAFRLEGMPEEAVTVFARKAGYAEATATVPPGAGASITVTLDRGGTLSGRVTGLPAAELQALEIYAMPTGGRMSMGGPARATVDASGAFTLSGVPDGEVIVSAQQSRPPRRRVSSTPVKVVAGNGPFVELDFDAGIIVRGKVTRRGEPVTRGMVHFVPSIPGERGRDGGSEIGPDGSYELRVSAAGEYRVMVTIYQSSVGTSELGLVDVRGEMRHDIEVRGAAVRIRVVDSATGAALPDVRVTLIGKGRSGTERATDSGGRAIFDIVTDATYTVQATKQGYASDPRDLVVQNGVDVDTDLVVTRGEEVVVRLIDAASGQAADAFVTILDASGRAVANRPPALDPTGAFRYWLRPGNYTIKVGGRDYEAKSVPLVVPTPMVQIELTRVNP